MTAGLSYDRVVPMDERSGIPGIDSNRSSSPTKSPKSSTLLLSSADATIQKHNDILREKKENLRRLLQQNSNGSMKMSSAPDLSNNKRDVLKEQRSLSFEERSSPLTKKAETAPLMPNLNDSPRSSSPTSVEGITNESSQSPRPSRSQRSSSSSINSESSSRSKKKRESKIKIFVLLLQPTSRIFELIQIVYNPDTTTIGDVLALIPQNATEQQLGAQHHRGFCRPMDGVEITDTTMLASGRRRTNCARIHRGEILVAIPTGHTGHDCMALAQPILQNPKLVRLLSQSNPKKSSARRGSRSRRSTPGSAGRSRARRSSTSLPIDTVIEEGDEDDEDMEDVASDLYSVGSDRGRSSQTNVSHRVASSAIQVQQPQLPVHQEDDDDSTVASNDSSIASSALARQIEELAESQGRQETSPQVSKKVLEQLPSTPIETISVSTPPRQTTPAPSTPPPASPVVGKTIYDDDNDFDCIEIGRVILTQSKRAVRICIRRSLEYYAIKSKEWNKRRRRRNASFLVPPQLIWMCLMFLMFMASVNKFTSDPQAETMAISSREASFGIFGLVKIFVILFILVEGQRNIHQINTESTEKSNRRASLTPTMSRRFKSMRKSPSAAMIRPMMEVEDNSRSASLSPRGKGAMYMQDWRETSAMN